MQIRETTFACVVEQTAPQPPQLFTLLVRLASQPVLTFASQFSQPALHMIWHPPPAQLGVPFVALQAAVQAPQFSALVLVFVSQPLPTLLSQLSKGAVQAMPQTLLAQLGVPPEELQAVSHTPQFNGVTLRSVSQPLASTPSQLP